MLDRLAVEDFFLPQNRRIFGAVQELNESRKPVDLLSVHETLMHSGDLEVAGSTAYVAQSGDGVPRVGSLEHYAQTVKAYSVRRKIPYQLEVLYEAGFAHGESEEWLLDRGIEALSEVARDRDADRDFGVPYRNPAAGLLQEFDAKDGVQIFTVIDELGRLTGGFRAGELVLFTAETGVGKTLLAEQTRRSCPDVGTRCLARAKCEHNT